VASVIKKSKILDALFPGIRHPILSATFLEPHRWWDAVEIAERAGVQCWQLDEELAALTSCGVLRRREREGAVEVQANGDCVVFRELHSIITKADLQAQQASGTILVVEDEPATLKITQILLESWGYHVLQANGATQALEIFEKSRSSIQLVLTDVMMPGMSGVQLAEKLREADPHVRIIYMSGYHNVGLVHTENRRVAFLQKPFSPERLAKMVEEELGRP
jgi:CheY-like chemotaxis protein